MIEFRHLRYFLAVAEHLSFRRAASQLNLSQQQVSQTIASLEAILDARLFERTTRNVALTEAGLTLVARARELLDHLDRALTDTQLSSRGETGKLTIGIAGGTAESLLPRVFSDFRDRFPQIHLDIRLQSSGAQIESLVQGEIDAGFAISPLPRPGLFLDILLRTGFVLQAPQSLIPDELSQCRLSDFRDQPFIALANSVTPGYSARSNLLFAEAGFVPRIVQYADNRQTIMTLVSAGVGVSVAPALIEGSQRVGVKNIPLASEVQVELVMVSNYGDRKKGLSSLRDVAKSVFGVADTHVPI
ncbi:MAG TPA: LysR substrate-binding domain-containing protein [Bryobacteraceae bacterium]|nr:LysR substrate-binding domain-containing protein [Bryobacteraceae bacterium]